METCFVNLIEPGDKVIVCVNGVFGGRMKENVRRIGGEAVLVEDAWGAPVDPNKVSETLARHNPDAKIVAFVHAETSTGAQSDAQTLCRIAREHGCLSIVDAVTIARRRAARGRCMGRRRGVFRHAEMPVVPARDFAGDDELRARWTRSANAMRRCRAGFSI